ncbi:hypothetical protein EON65_54435 [archaeon]|nr:MAG: hypothetical protein EON65_54435 [archaeon]
MVQYIKTCASLESQTLDLQDLVGPFHRVAAVILHFVLQNKMEAVSEDIRPAGEGEEVRSICCTIWEWKYDQIALICYIGREASSRSQHLEARPLFGSIYE